jgi:hypothetical protein
VEPSILGEAKSGDEAKIRLLFCMKCKTLEELPDYEGHPDDDYLLQILVEKHQSTGIPHPGQLMRVPALLWMTPKFREEITKQIYAKGAPGLDALMPGYYDIKNTFAEDAMTCWKQHNRTLNCSDYGSEKKVLRPDTGAERKNLGLAPADKNSGPKTYMCQFCPVHSHVVTKKRDKAGMYK